MFLHLTLTPGKMCRLRRRLKYFKSYRPIELFNVLTLLSEP